MIFDSLKNMDNYKGIPQVYRALEIIRDTDFSRLTDGTYEVDGFNFRYLLQSYIAEHDNDRPESHQDFIDVQYLISGKERMGVGLVSDMTEEVEAKPESDIWFYHGPLDCITLQDDRFAVLFPNDAHAPGIVPQDGPVPVRKCVFKIHV